MDTPEFPPNSRVSKGARDRDITPVTTTGAKRKKKSMRKQFQETFIAGDAKSAVQYMIFDIALPAAQDLFLESFIGGVEKLVRGDSYRRRGSTPPQSGPAGNVQYNYQRVSMGPSRLSSPQRAISRQARARHNFDEIVLDQRAQAEEVIDRLFDLVSRYESASVADLYDLVGLSSNHTDQKWGWVDLQGAGVSRVRGGYLLDLPEPEPLD